MSFRLVDNDFGLACLYYGPLHRPQTSVPRSHEGLALPAPLYQRLSPD